MSRHTGDGPLWVMQVVALYGYDPEEHDELAFREGDTIRVVRVQDDGWWQGYALEDPSRVGVFPSNYVQVQQRRPVETRAQEGPQRQRIHQQQRKSRVRFASPPASDDELEEDEDEGDYQPQRLPHSAKTSSVLLLKQRLADAERLSRAAHEARRKAEQEQFRSRRVQRVDRRQWAGRELEDADEDEDREDAFSTQEQWRYQQKQSEVDEESEGDGDDHSDDQARGGEEDEDKGDEEDEEPVEEDEEDDYSPTARFPVDEIQHEGDRRQDQAGNGSFSVPFEQRNMMDEVIAEYNDRRLHSVDDEAAAASCIARQYRLHHREQQRKHESKRRQKASAVITQSLRKNVKRSQEAKLQQRQSSAALAIQRWLAVRASSAREKGQHDNTTRQEEAAIRIQQWMRHRVVYLKWLAHVEAERVEMARQRETRLLHEQRERLEEEQRRHEADEVRKRQREQDTRQLPGQEQKSEPKKAKRRVMKQEAVELVKALVTQQLNEKLREHDDQMLELQRMLSSLQDVIREQSKMIQASADEILHLEQQQVQHASQRPLRPSPSASLVKHSEPTTCLPVLQQQKCPPAPSATSGVARPSGLKPPRQIDRIPKLPLLNSPSSSSAPAKR